MIRSEELIGFSAIMILTFVTLLGAVALVFAPPPPTIEVVGYVIDKESNLITDIDCTFNTDGVMTCTTSTSIDYYFTAEIDGGTRTFETGSLVYGNIKENHWCNFLKYEHSDYVPQLIKCSVD